MAAALTSHPASARPARRTRRARFSSRALGLGAAGIAFALTLSSCGTSLPDPNDTAEAWASQLASDELTEVDTAALAADSSEPDALVEALAQLESYPVTVTLDEVAVDEEAEGTDEAEDAPATATATYTVTWDLSGETSEESDQSEATESAEASDSAEASAESTDEWSYTAETTLVWDEEAEAWQPRLTPESLVPGLAEGGAVVVAETASERGRILDGEGEPIVTNRPVQRIGIDKARVMDALQIEGEPTDAQQTEAEELLTESATALAEVLDLDIDIFTERTLNAGQRAFVEFITLRADGSTGIPSEEINQITGARAIEDTQMLAPTRSFARSVLGTFGEPSAEQVENSDGTLKAGVATGLSGLQATFNDELSGTSGLEITVDNEAGSDDAAASDTAPEHDPVSFTREPIDGASITTTLHQQVQQLAEDTLAESEVPAGLVVVRPSDGHILAAADGPESMSWPVAMSGKYAPGSTYKLITALAMLRNGMTPESTVSCPATINTDGTEIGNFDGYPTQFLGEITLAQAIAQSCNTVFVGQWNDITAQQEYDAAVALGLVADPIVGFDGAFLGSIPDDATGAGHAANLFGQGVTQASPLGMATVSASIAAGSTVSPIVVTDPEVDPTENENLPGNTPLTEEEAAQLRELMAGPVNEGTVPILQQVPGAPVLAKTGTAQFVSEGETLAHTWITSIHGDLAVALFFNEGFAGSQTNGPVLHEFLTELEEIIPSE
ncbi:penicillin-binding transpeptidase domain-containing protein [Citricoccus sp. NR2]|uniref:penicillin-binding transpeptidase domain-containing protein n=1 Tax=Citricoccus sp. NR2 TaxID=3004095 RepID=UPI0022DCF577|nr:penicillin-binding transpeptidase domain-containing protein [Citricoccus sp. NR2]WBL20406.1 penicillin-binding transpeptidase domain-containing protein [Citricoccus sp. NR2]